MKIQQGFLYVRYVCVKLLTFDASSPEHGFSELLRSGRYAEAKRFFSDLLKKLCSVSAAISDGDRTAACKLQLSLADAWEGRGMASAGLGEMAEVRLARDMITIQFTIQ